jgi:hypothetical protein
MPFERGRQINRGVKSDSKSNHRKGLYPDHTRPARETQLAAWLRPFWLGRAGA